MDNIQKSIIAVLGLAAFITFIIPTGDSFGPKQPEPELVPAPIASEPSAPPPEQTEEGGNEYASQDGEIEGPDEFESFGQPMNDAQPLGVSDNIAPQSESPQTNLPAGAFGGQQDYAGGSQAAPIYVGPTNAPIVTNQPVE